MSDHEDPAERLSPAAEVFAEFLARHENGDAPDFEAFCAEHVPFEPRLRRLHARWRELAGAFEGGATAGDAEVSFGDLVPESIREPRDGHYEQRQLIARGGMGEIHEVWDATLRRSLAMKVLLSDEPARDPDAPCSGQNPRSLGRFLEEAQVTAQLHHPGIVPVHELGLDAAGRVYFTMALIRGQTLGEVFELARQGRDDWNLTRVLGVLLRVCEAVAFAHSKGVLHRDLKPANVMVGAFGETYVMDWGLAQAAGGELRSFRRDVGGGSSDSPLATMAGDVVGTPAYMPPEQAAGEIARIGPQSDVYAIGATLYQLLTGRVPYVDDGERPDPRTVLDRVRQGPPRAVAQLARDVPAELCSICDKAMARAPEDRYSTVRALGDDLRAYLETRVVRAHAVGAWAELRKWIRRNKGLSIASTTAAVALVIGLVVSLRERARADDQAMRAEANFSLAMEAIDRMLTRVGDKTLVDVPGMDVVRKDVLQEALALNREVLASRSGDPTAQLEVAKAHKRVSVIHWQLGEYDLAEAAQRDAIAAYGALMRQDPDEPGLNADYVWSHNALGSYLLSRGRADEARSVLERALSGMVEVVEDLPDDPVHRERQAIVLSQLLVACHRLHEDAQALTYGERALAIREALAAEHPDSAHYRSGAASQCVNVGYMLERLGRDGDALAAYDKAVRSMRVLIGADPGKRGYREQLAKLLSNRGIVEMKQGRAGSERAVVSLEEAATLNRALVADFPDVPSYRASLGGSLSNLGQALHNLGDLPAARRRLEEALHETRAAHAAAPEDPQVHSYLLRQHDKLFGVLRRLRLHRDAAACAESYAQLGFFDEARRTGQAAAWLGACARLVRDDGSLATTERSRMIDEYGDRAVALLRRAVECGFADTRVLASDDLDVLREREDFRGLFDDVKSKAAAEGGRD